MKTTLVVLISSLILFSCTSMKEVRSVSFETSAFRVKKGDTLSMYFVDQRLVVNQYITGYTDKVPNKYLFVIR